MKSSDIQAFRAKRAREKAERDALVKKLMRSGRHLSAHRLARAANRLTSGADWRGSTKTDIVSGLLEANVSPKAISYAFETFENSKGKMVITRNSAASAASELESLLAKVATLKKDAASYTKRTGKQNYAILNPICFAEQRARALKNGLAEWESH